MFVVPAISLRCAAPAARGTADATTRALLVLVLGSSVPIPTWSGSCRLFALSLRTRYEHDDDVPGRPPETAVCWGSLPRTGRGRSDTHRSWPACPVLGACPTSALHLPLSKATADRDGSLPDRHVRLSPQFWTCDIGLSAVMPPAVHFAAYDRGAVGPATRRTGRADPDQPVAQTPPIAALESSRGN